MKSLLATTAICLVVCASTFARADELTPIELQCEHVNHPMGVDATHPRLSWAFGPATVRGQRQTAYQILVASSKKSLDADQADLWDSGKVRSNENREIRYVGKPLQPGTSYFWKVRVWDQDDQAGPFSATATFDTGLQTEEGWQGAAWIAWRPYDEWKQAFDARKKKETTPPIDKDDGWVYPTRFRKGASEKAIRDAEFNVFEMIEFHETPYDPAPLFRREFILNKPIRRARAYVSGLGYYELYLNGHRVGDHQLDPGWTDSQSRVLYTTYDVTDRLTSGDNAIGVMLGRGFPGSLILDEWGFYKSSIQPQLRMRLHIEYTDGTQQDVLTQPGWKVTGGPILFDDPYRGEVHDARQEPPGWNRAGFDDSAWDTSVRAPTPEGRMVGQVMQPIRAVEEVQPVSVTNPEPGVYVYDFGKNMAGWARLNLSGPAGTKVLVRYSELNAPGRPPLPERGSFHYAYQQYGFILSGKGTETFEPRFSYTAFRYAVVSGAPEPLDENSMVARHVHTDVPMAGEFECSNPLLNKLYRAIRLTELNNTHGIFTDCPTREKHGWGEGRFSSETAIYNFDMTAFYEKWVQDFADIESQNAQGRLYAYAPRPEGILNDAPVWQAILVSVPWELYVYRGDRGILETHYETMKRFVDALRSIEADKNEPYIIKGRYGDWISPSGGQKRVMTTGPYKSKPTPKEGLNLYGTAAYYECADTLSKIAEVLGRSDDAERYRRLAENIYDAYNRKFYDPEQKCYRGEIRQITEYRQSADAISLYYGLVPEERQPQIIENLKADLAARNDRINTGLFGTKALMQVLPAGGADEAAYRAAVQTQYPGWGDLIEKGMTTISEAWGGKGSQDHPSFGSVGAYYYRWLGGLQPDPERPGFRHFLLRPTFVKDLNWVRVAYDSPSGRIQSRWARKGHQITWDIVVPPNTTASVFIPAAPETVTESGQTATDAAGVKQLRTENDLSVFSVTAGTYRFCFSKE